MRYDFFSELSDLIEIPPLNYAYVYLHRYKCETLGNNLLVTFVFTTRHVWLTWGFL